MTKQQRYFIGFVNTPLLWLDNPINGLQQFSIAKTQIPFQEKIDKNIRLGKWVERLVSHQLQQDDSIKIIEENIIIYQEKRTIGELDCLLLKHNTPYHVEIVYKFYLYDPTVGTSEIDCWIGPNRKDSLTEKIDKLTTKQLPLLYKNETQSVLKQIGLNVNHILQRVHFKAQLFIPYHLNNHNFKLINPNCIVGYYYTFEEIKTLQNCKFFIPEKLNWLSEVDVQINWLTFSEFKPQLKLLLEQKRSPMVWIKDSKGHTQKCFVVWW
ncbi:DUF1853 family protein [Mangrovimonas spongiae]|uniref:DUF1853 family protein n=1 Tax=Mangrovimonas spongiae TaxID=2494697 RepID=A0A3R9NVH9_9FLAO|nr:DUF1853 family protein [Mangrovimonas spongiae]RSK38554.1 DUF1853 family protein [Mangrovimonas spongiae]